MRFPPARRTGPFAALRVTREKLRVTREKLRVTREKLRVTSLSS
jgi:hypothetical protein